MSQSEDQEITAAINWVLYQCAGAKGNLQISHHKMSEALKKKYAQRNQQGTRERTLSVELVYETDILMTDVIKKLKAVEEKIKRYYDVMALETLSKGRFKPSSSP